MDVRIDADGSIHHLDEDFATLLAEALFLGADRGVVATVLVYRFLTMVLTVPLGLLAATTIRRR